MKKTAPILSPKYQQLLEEFRSDCQLRQRGAVRAEEVSNIRDLLAFLECRHRFRIRQVTAADIIAYGEQLRNRLNRYGNPLASSTISGYVRAVSKFNEFLLATGRTRDSWGLLRVSRQDKQERLSLSQEETDRLFRVCESARDRAILAIAYGCGLRRSEMVRLDVTDVHLRSGVLIVREGKFHKRREVPLTDGVIAYLRVYVTGERFLYLKADAAPEPAFFVNNCGKRMRGAHLNGRVKHLATLAGIPHLPEKPVGLHSLRHSIAEHLLDGGADIEFVQEFLGHTCIDTTMIYARKQQQKRKTLQHFKR